MANKNTRSLRKEGKVGINNGPTWATRAYEVFKGTQCATGFGQAGANKRKSKWKGAGDPLGRKKAAERAA